jgi:magnesium chelatase accessory protein
MYRKPAWSREGVNWPHKWASKWVNVGSMTWHVQTMGTGPVLLLLHGTGSATHSWEKLMPLLAQHYTLVAPDLPGHGFTTTPKGDGLSLTGMAALMGALIGKLDLESFALIGHSAGAALAAQLILAGQVKAQHLVAINGAFKPFDGVAAHVFPAIAKLFALNPVTILALAAGGGDIARVTKLMDATGSKLDARALELYTRLFGTPGHVAGVMGMMARWDLSQLGPRMSNLNVPTTLIVGSQDLTISPNVSAKVARQVPNARLVTLPGLGHLAHEEDAASVASVIEAALRSPTD